MKIFITIEGRPKSKSNHKTFGGHVYLSDKHRKYERYAAWQAHQQMKKNNWRRFEEPIFLIMRFYFKPGIRLDLTNCPKSLCDGLNKLVWKDDRLIHKCYLEMHTDLNERVEIEAWNISEAQETLAFEKEIL